MKGISSLKIKFQSLFYWGWFFFQLWFPILSLENCFPKVDGHSQNKSKMGVDGFSYFSLISFTNVFYFLTRTIPVLCDPCFMRKLPGAPLLICSYLDTINMQLFRLLIYLDEMKYVYRKSWILWIWNVPRHSFSHMVPTRSNLYIKATQWNLKMWPLWAIALYMQVKIICTIH